MFGEVSLCQCDALSIHHDVNITNPSLMIVLNFATIGVSRKRKRLKYPVRMPRALMHAISATHSPFIMM